MRLTPLDIRKQEFSRSLRGYDSDEVQAFLQMLSRQWEEVVDEDRRKNERIRELENRLVHYEKVEEALQEALLTARETSRKALENAEQKARLIVEEAERRAEDVKRDAELERHQIKREAAKLSGRRSEIVTRLRAFLMSEMELLARFEGDDPVGFIKLLPAEEHRLQQSTRERPDDEGTHGVSAAGNATEPIVNEAFVASTSEEVEDDQREMGRAAEEAPYGVEWSDDRFAETEGPQETVGEDESVDEPGDEPGEDVFHGQGWTAHAVVSRPAERHIETSGWDDETDGSVGEGDRDEEDRDRASAQEIEKIRRILSDLD